jgi:hypothetical protein
VTPRRAATGLLVALLLGTAIAGCSRGSTDLAPGQVPAEPVGIGEVFRDPFSPYVAGRDLDDLAADGGRLVRLRTPYAVVRVAVSAPGATAPAPPAGAGTPRPAAEGAVVRTVVWEGTGRDDVGPVLGPQAEPQQWRLSLVAEEEHVVLGEGDGDLPPSSGGARVVVAVPADATLAVALEVAGETQVVPLDPGGEEDLGAAAGLVPLRVEVGECRLRSAPGGVGDPVGRLVSAVVESSYWPGLGWAPDGRTWRAVRLRGEVVAPGALPLTRYRLTLDGAGPPRPVGDLPFAGDRSTEIAAVFDVPAGAPGRAVRLGAPGARGVLCMPTRWAELDPSGP